MDYFLVAPDFLYFIFGVAVALLILVEFGVLRHTGSRFAVNRRYILVLLLLSLFGSYVNIPLAQIPSHVYITQHEYFFWGMKYIVPIVVNRPGTEIAVNVGGALIPILLSAYLLIKNKLYLLGLLGIIGVAVIVHLLASPVPGTGIAVPVFIPPVVTAAIALLLSRPYAAPLAYICGSFGTLIGGDLLNLGRVPSLGTPVASIGGAGTFDGIFITGLFAMLIVSFLTRGRS
ncbi:MAG TPA: DUF1614 domain-containing protein, partial [Nitrococcus sp.]|nr:DUF1614 domain-containing protein [Nitrococcus sp.]